MLVCSVAACGGRYLEIDDGEGSLGGTHSADGGAAAQAGKGGRPVEGGAPSSGARAGSPTAGSVASGGATNCTCDAIACGPGYTAVPNPDGCCFHCEVDRTSCAAQSHAYRMLRAQLIEKYSSVGCQLSSDCGVYYESNACASGGCGIPMSTTMLSNLATNLASFAAATCDGTCPPPPEPPCLSPEFACVEGRCR
jgi:hypothetical protein